MAEIEHYIQRVGHVAGFGYIETFSNMLFITLFVSLLPQIMPVDNGKSNRARKPTEKVRHRRDVSQKSKGSKAREVWTPKPNKRKRAMSSEASSDPSKQSEEEDEETDKDAPASTHRNRHKAKSRSVHHSHPRSVTPGRSTTSESEVEEVAISTQDDDIVELLSVDTRHSGEYGDVHVSRHSMSIL